jgi:hypothetical protein
MRRKDMFDLQAETARMQAARLGVIIRKADWSHVKSGPTSGCLEGTWGLEIRAHIEGRYSGGLPPPEIDAEGNSISRSFDYSPRWRLIQSVTSGETLISTLAAKRSLLYRLPPIVEGELTESPIWKWVRERSRLDIEWVKRQSLLMHGVSCAIRPVWQPYAAGGFYPVSVATIPADRCIAVRNPANPGSAGLFIEFCDDGADWKRKEYIRVWDVMDPRAPYYGEWRDVYSWQRNDTPLSPLMYGLAYPWWSGEPGVGEPMMPAPCCSADPTAEEMLPVLSGVHQRDIDIIMKRAWIGVVCQAGSFDRVFAISEQELKGLQNALLQPGVVANIWGAQGANLQVVPNSTEAAKNLLGMLDDERLAIAQDIEPAFQSKEATGAKSGRAIELEMTGLDVLKQRMEMWFRPNDIASIEAVRATHNYLIRSEQLSMRIVDGDVQWTPGLEPQADPSLLIHGGAISIRYPSAWNAIERAALREKLQKSVDVHQEEPAMLWLFDHEMEDTADNRILARDKIAEACSESVAAAVQGYGQTWQQLANLATRTSEDEAARYNPPADVSDTAAKGLSLKTDFPGRAMNGADSTSQKLRNRARSLAGGDPFLIGALRELDQWHKQHAGDSQRPADVGQWGNDADPSGPYITWLSQGGAQAVTWLAAILQPVETTPSPAVQNEPATGGPSQ